MNHPFDRGISRRRMLAGLAGLATLGPVFKVTEGVASAALNTHSAPSKLRITDIRACTLRVHASSPIIRIDTNQGVYGLGEVRDGGNKAMALILKPLLVGKNPLEIEPLLASIRKQADHGRLGGGYSAIDMALHDIAGKVYNAPAWKLIGEKKRDEIRCYCDTPSVNDPKRFAERLKQRREMGFTFFKMDLMPSLLRRTPGALNESGTANEKGIEIYCAYLAAAREAIGDAPLAADHFGVITVENAIRHARAFESYKLAWAEDFLRWRDWRGYKAIKAATTTPILTGEDIFGLDGFKDLIDNEALDIIHPDPLTSGALRETKRIADYAEKKGIPTALHFAGSPVGFMACVHISATLGSFLALENHSVDDPWWSDLVLGLPKPIIQNGSVAVPDKPGLGVELNEPVVREHLRMEGYFEADPPEKMAEYQKSVENFRKGILARGEYENKAFM